MASEAMTETTAKGNKSLETKIKIASMVTADGSQMLTNDGHIDNLLTDKQKQTLRAALDTAIPPDDYPGAWDAGVGDYLLRQFTRDLKQFLVTYRDGLDSLNQEAVIANGMAFASLALTQRTLMFARLEAGEYRAEWKTPARQFIDMLASHAAEGYYADPGNGGNRNGVSWDMIGFIVTA